MQVDGVAQPVRAREEPHRPAAQAGDEIDGGLDHLVGAADQVGLLRADGDGQAFLPVRLGAVAGGGAGAAAAGRSSAERVCAAGQGAGGDEAGGGAEDLATAGVERIVRHGEVPSGVELFYTIPAGNASVCMGCSDRWPRLTVAGWVFCFSPGRAATPAYTSLFNRTREPGRLLLLTLPVLARKGLL